ncbi:hypothetical protein MKZ38_008913 [Zalerion maritima]|uniref:Uncharacterized protein n=1 Tax=Zalerion maritima TaxID=339359 RepID=A0AAD5RGY4_9PEZI|nr:hypothetical protein MKZ38_008913 [Zalerion maritima]
MAPTPAAPPRGQHSVEVLQMNAVCYGQSAELASFLLDGSQLEGNTYKDASAIAETCDGSPLSIVKVATDGIGVTTADSAQPAISESAFWQNHFKRANGYFGYRTLYGNSGDVTGHYQGLSSSSASSAVTWIRFIIKQVLDKELPKGKDYLWRYINIFTQWLVDPTSPGKPKVRIVIFDTQDWIRDWLRDELSPLIPNDLGQLEESIADPYWFHAAILEKLVSIHDEAIWSIRDRIRSCEKKRPDPLAPKPDYPALHDDARHAIHMYETVELAEEEVEAIIEQHEFLMRKLERVPLPPGTAQSSTAAIRNWEPLHSRLRFCRNFLASLKARSRSNTERLRNEINLAFNTVAQHDSRMSVNLTKAASMDGSAMRTIAVVTLVFLPATFVAAIFSTGFFDFGFGDPDPGRGGGGPMRVSREFWVYWAFAAPLTAATILAWFVWHEHFLAPWDAWRLEPKDAREPARRPTAFTQRSSRSGLFLSR